MKNTFKRVLCFCFLAVFSLSLYAGKDLSYAANGGQSVGQQIIASFTDVTGQVDFSNVAKANFNSKVLRNTNAEAETTERTVIVSLSGSTLLSGIAEAETAGEYLNSAEGKSAARRIEDTHNTFFKRLKAHGISYSVVQTYNTVDNAVAIRVDKQYISDIKSFVGVESVVVSETYAVPKTTQSTTSAVTNATNVYKTGIYDSSELLDTYSGQGVAVAVLDSGFDYTHSAFQKLPSDLNNLALTKSDIATAVRAEGEAALSAVQRSAQLGEEVTENELYLSAKIPFAYDYADDDYEVYPSYSTHGTHVAGIIGGNDDSYTDKDGNLVNEPFVSVAPDVQLVLCKVFTDDLYSEDLGGAVTEDILSALEDCIKLKVDIINMSLGTSCGFSTTDDGDSEGDLLNKVYDQIKTAGISLIVAASNDYSSGYGGPFGTNLTSNPDSATVGAPSTYTSALSVASISGKQSDYMLANAGTDMEAAIFYEESSDENSQPYDFSELILKGETTKEFEYVVVPNYGRESDYTTPIKNLFKEGNKIAVVSRGDNTFKEKVEAASNNGAVAIIVYNNVAGKIRMNLGDIEDSLLIPAVSVTLTAGEALKNGAGSDREGVIKIDDTLKAGPFMSEFTSWGTTPDLKLKPEITAHGGEITSSVPGGYAEQSGTSMATPNVAGLTAILRSYVKQAFKNGGEEPTAVEVTRITNQLMMSTATTVMDEDNLPYSPRRQGAGLASLSAAVSTKALIYTDSEENDYRPKIEFGDDAERRGVYTADFYLSNFGTAPLSFELTSLFMTETLSPDGLAVAEKAYMLDDVTPEWQVDGEPCDGAVTVSAGGKVKISFTLSLSGAEKEYIDTTFKNGMFVEGFIKLISADSKQCDLSIPFLGFYGDWTDAPMLDYTAYEISDFQQDASLNEDEKPKASVWETQAFTSYYNDDYILPMGSYLYTVPEDADEMYTKEEYSSVSRYNEYVSEDGIGNYMTSTRIQAVYAGLLRNARSVDYKMYNVDTGELILEDTIHRVGKAYAGGGSAMPANVELKLYPDQYGLVNNGHYKMEFEFRLDYNEGKVSNKNTFEFAFYVDYEAPVLEDLRVRYVDKDEGKKQQIFLDFDVYDNHYAQSLMLCYLEEDELKLVTDYVTPIRKANKNGTTTVSVEITDIYDKYKDKLYVQVEDYALNHSVYYLELDKASKAVLPDEFEIVGAGKDGNLALTLGKYETKKVQLSYEGDAHVSNFEWKSLKPAVANVKNGEIVGLKPGTATITVYNGKVSRRINVTVTESDKKLSRPGISFGLIENKNEAMVKAQGLVEMHPNAKVQLTVETDPWYYPAENLDLIWSSTDPSVATVDDDGNVHTLKKGTASISATLKDDNGNATNISSTVMLRVGEEFIVSNFVLTDYNGLGGKVVIPTDMNIMYIGTEAFKDNDNITEIVIPKTVLEIQEKAFIGCTALRRVSFVQDTPMEIADADVYLINRRAFYNCTALETLDFSNTKIFTVGPECFVGCTSLSNVIKMENIGTLHDMAFAGCTSLKSAKLSNLHVAGDRVFSGCTSLKNIETARYSIIGDRMFEGCPIESVVIKTPKVGDRAFADCTTLTSVTFDNGGNDALEFSIGEGAFENTSLTSLDFGTCSIRAIGDRAFAGCTKLAEFAMPDGLEQIGRDVFSGSGITKLTLNDSYDISNIYSSTSPFAGLKLQEFDVKEGSALYTVLDSVIFNKDCTKLLLVPGERQGGFVIPLSVAEIAPNAFYANKYVKSISGGMLEFNDGTKTSVLHVSVIGSYAFAESSILSVELNSNVTEIGEGAFRNSRLETVTFADESAIKEIPANAFRGTNIKAIDLPYGITYVGDYAFAETDLQTFVNNGVREMTFGNGVFYRCETLKTIELLDKITVMGDETFSGCVSLEEVTMPAVKSVGRFTFINTPSLKKVVYSSDASELGYAAFAMDRWFAAERRQLTAVDLGGIKAIDDCAFVNCVGLEAIDLTGVTGIGADAFYNCSALKTVSGLSGVEEIGNEAFYMAGIVSADLECAEYVGSYAFAESDLASVSLGENLEYIGEMAFVNTSFAAVNIPKGVKEIGYGAFSAIRSLQGITVEADNEKYFAEDGVLYRIIEEGNYQLINYPAGKTAAVADGKKTYNVKEGTTSIAAYAFDTLTKGVIDHVVLPYSVKTVGHRAFYQSGVKEYSFNSINAPVLENVYLQEVADYITSLDGTYTGCFYANFEELLVNYFVNYNDKVGSKESELIINVPENGKGYDSFIYRTYFKTFNSLGVLMDDYTRECKGMIESLYGVDEIKNWINEDNTEENKNKVLSFAERVQLARLYYGNVTDAKQREFIGQANADKLTALEAALRDIKKAFGISVNLSKLDYLLDSYKSNYVEGETFDMTGLVVIAMYDDGSTEVIDISEVTLKEAAPLTTLDRTVTVVARGKDLRVKVVVTAAGTGDSSSDSSGSSSSTGSTATDTGSSSGQSEEKDNGWLLYAGIGVGAAAVIAAGVVVFLMVKKNKKN